MGRMLPYYFLPSSVVPSSWLCFKHEVDSGLLLSFYCSSPSSLWSERKKEVHKDSTDSGYSTAMQDPSVLSSSSFILSWWLNFLGCLIVQCGCQSSSHQIPILGRKQDQKGLPAVHHPIKEASSKFYATIFFYLTAKT